MSITNITEARGLRALHKSKVSGNGCVAGLFADVTSYLVTSRWIISIFARFQWTSRLKTSFVIGKQEKAWGNELSEVEIFLCIIE